MSPTKQQDSKLHYIDPEIEAEIIAMEIGAAEIELSELPEDHEPRQSPIATAAEIAAEVKVDIATAVQEGVV